MAGLFWALLILIVAVALLVLEMFIPSGGLLGLMAGASFIASLVFVFQESTALGLAYLVGLAVALPLCLMAMVKYWPHTSVGRMMLNLPPPGTEPESIFHPLEDLIGKRGTAKTKMLPSGAVVINGRTYDAVSAGMAIEPGDPIEVYRVEGNRITIRLLTSDSPAASDSPDSSDSPNAVQRNIATEIHNASAEPQPNALDRTYDDVIPDPFDDSLP